MFTMCSSKTHTYYNFYYTQDVLLLHTVKYLPLFDIKHLASFEPIPRLDSHTLAQ